MTSKRPGPSPLLIIITIFNVCICGLAISASPLGNHIENKKIKMVQNEALKGNQFALEMIRYPALFKYEDKKLINEALNGNENALIILGIKIKEEKK